MKKSLSFLIGLLAIALLLGGCITLSDYDTDTPGTDKNNQDDDTSTGEQTPPVNVQSLVATFAISNSDGNKLITFTMPAQAVDYACLDTAIGKNGQPFAISYIGEQVANDIDTGRVSASNFDNMPGNVYQISDPPVEANQTYFLYDSGNNITENLLVPTVDETVAISADALAEVSAAKGRMAQQGWQLKEYENGSRILLLLFVPDGKNLLMSIAFKTSDKIKFMDYPAILNNNSAWRVDDGGTVDPRFFTVLFAVNTTDGMAAAISWAGSEGENTFFLIESGNTLIEMPESAYRYWSAG